MQTSKLRVRRKMTEKEKLDRRARKRRFELRGELAKQYTVIGFHRLFKYEDQEAQHKLELEVDEAKRKAADLEKLL